MVRGQREKIQSGPTGIKSLKTREECSIGRRRARLYSGGMHVGGVRRESHNGDTVGGVSPRVITAKISNLDKESCEHLRWTNLVQVQHCTDLPRQVIFPEHTEQGNMGPGMG